MEKDVVHAELHDAELGITGGLMDEPFFFDTFRMTKGPKSVLIGDEGRDVLSGGRGNDI